MDGSPRGTSAQTPPEPVQAQAGRHVGRVDELVRQEQALTHVHPGLLSQVVLVADLVDQVVDDRPEVHRIHVQEQNTCWTLKSVQA